MKRAWYETSPGFELRTFPGGGRLWTHRATGLAVGGAAVCIDGRTRAVRFHASGSQVYAGAWSGSVRVDGRTYAGTAYASDPIDGPPVLRWAFRFDMLAARAPRYDSPFRIVGRAPTDPAGFVVECVEVELVDGRPVPSEHSRLWIETPTAEAEGIDPYSV